MGFAQNREKKMIVPFQATLVIEIKEPNTDDYTGTLRRKLLKQALREMDSAVHDWVRENYPGSPVVNFRHFEIKDRTIITVLGGTLDDKDLDVDTDLPEDE